jgi:hypothetical protein
MLSVSNKSDMLNVIMLNAIMLSVSNKSDMPNVIILNVILLNVIMLKCSH